MASSIVDTTVCSGSGKNVEWKREAEGFEAATPGLKRSGRLRGPRRGATFPLFDGGNKPCTRIYAPNIPAERLRTNLAVSLITAETGSSARIRPICTWSRSRHLAVLVNWRF